MLDETSMKILLYVNKHGEVSAETLNNLIGRKVDIELYFLESNKYLLFSSSKSNETEIKNYVISPLGRAIIKDKKNQTFHFLFPTIIALISLTVSIITTILQTK